MNHVYQALGYFICKDTTAYLITGWLSKNSYNPDLPTSAPSMKGVNFLKTMELLGLFPSNTLHGNTEETLNT